jgi:hypothetical protein
LKTIDYPLSVPKVPTEIDGFDLIANGGLPSRRVTLISRTTASKLKEMDDPLVDGARAHGSPLSDRAG